MLKYHNFSKIKNQKVFGLKFHGKFCGRYPIAPIPNPTSRHSAGAGVGISCYITKGLLTVTDFQLNLKDRVMAKTSSVGAYHVKPFSLSLLPAPSLKARFHIPP